jgi:hypothetical protein
MIGQPTGQSFRDRHFSPASRKLGGPSAQLMMGPTEIVGTAKQPQAVFQSSQTPGRVPTFARQAGQALTHGPVEPFTKGRIEHRSTARGLKQPLCVFQRPVNHGARNLHHAFLLRSFDDQGDT